MNKHEKKYNNTEIKLYNAIIDLLNKKSFGEITVSEICKTSNINRTTFYAHFNNVAELFTATKKHMLKKFMDNYPTVSDNYIEELPVNETNFISPANIIPYLRFIKENRAFFKMSLEMFSFKDDDFYEHLLKKVSAPILRKQGFTDPTVILYMTRYVMNGIIAITMEWIKRDCIDDEYFVCEIMSFCTISPKFPQEHTSE